MLWISVAQGELQTGESIKAGDMVAFEHAEVGVTLTSSGTEDAVFVLGSAVVHAHDLTLGHYSVHTNDEALRRGEANIANIRVRMQQDRPEPQGGKSVPIFR